MIARGAERAGQAAEQAATVVLDRRGAPVHQSRRANHARAEHLAHRLMAEAHAQQRQLARELAHHLERDAGFVRRARAGRDQDPLGRAPRDARDVDRVVPVHLDLGAELARGIAPGCR